MGHVLIDQEFPEEIRQDKGVLEYRGAEKTARYLRRFFEALFQNG